MIVVTLSEMKMLLPIFRKRWNTAVVSPSTRLSKVANVATTKGTQTSPTEVPCMKLASITSVIPTFMSKVII